MDIASDQLTGLSSQELEQTLKDVVVAVTKELQSTTVPSFTTTADEANQLEEFRNPIGTEIELDGEIQSQARPRKLSGTEDEEESKSSGTGVEAKTESSTDNCTTDQFLCHDGGCVDRYLRCDKIKDCRDASDEFDCGESC